MNNDKLFFGIKPNIDADELVETLLAEYHEVVDKRSIDEVIVDLKQRGVVFEHVENRIPINFRYILQK